jgi:4-amino-4-deoxy-L-arabinose transferase-like glycosyltransferase
LRSAHKAAFSICAALLFLFFRGIGDHGLLDPVEGINASVTLNMAGRLDFFNPLAGDLPYLGKSLGFWWLSALTLILSGWREWPLRLWPALGGLGMAAASWFIARRMMNERAANCAAVLTGTSLLTYAASQLAAPYTLYAFCVTAALAGAVYGFRDRRFFLLLHGASSAAMLVCGPAGLLLPWLCLLLYACLTEQYRFFADALFYMPGLSATLALGGGYALLLYFKSPALLASIRYLPPSAAFGSFPSALLFLAFGFFPWAGLVPETIKRSRPRDWLLILPSERENVLLFAWTAVFLFFGLFSRDAFFLAAPLPALAALCAARVMEAVESGDIKTLRRMTVWEFRFFGACLLLGLLCFFFGGANPLRKTLMSLVPWAASFVLFLFAGWRYVETRQPLKWILALGVAALLSLMPLAGVFDLLADRISPREIGLFLRETLKLSQNDRIAQYGANRPSLFFYTAKDSLLFHASPIPGVVGQKIENDALLNEIWGKSRRVFMIVEREQKILRPLRTLPYNVYEKNDQVVLSDRRAPQSRAPEGRAPGAAR